MVSWKLAIMASPAREYSTGSNQNPRDRHRIPADCSTAPWNRSRSFAKLAARGSRSVATARLARFTRAPDAAAWCRSLHRPGGRPRLRPRPRRCRLVCDCSAHADLPAALESSSSATQFAQVASPSEEAADAFAEAAALAAQSAVDVPTRPDTGAEMLTPVEPSASAITTWLLGAGVVASILIVGGLGVAVLNGGSAVEMAAAPWRRRKHRKLSRLRRRSPTLRHLYNRPRVCWRPTHRAQVAQKPVLDPEQESIPDEDGEVSRQRVADGKQYCGTRQRTDNECRGRGGRGRSGTGNRRRRVRAPVRAAVRSARFRSCAAHARLRHGYVERQGKHVSAGKPAR